MEINLGKGLGMDRGRVREASWNGVAAIEEEKQ